MPIRNHNWYDLQSTRRYPLDDLSTGTGDDGARLRDNIITDLHLRFPSTLGQYAFVSGISITERLVTVTFLAATDLDDTTAFTPLAAITLSKPVVQSRHYALDSLYPGVGGWIVFGSGIDEDFSARFSSARQALVTAKCARPYRPLPIPSLGKLFRETALTGLINIRAGADLNILKETITVDDVARDALVIRLNGPVLNRNPLETYVGPCDKRPESRTCLKPGVELINTVAPDCDGNIEIDFGSLLVAPFAGCGNGLALEHAAELADVCEPNDVPTEGPRGRDLCDLEELVSSSSSMEEIPTVSSSVSNSEGSEGSSIAEDCDELPHCESFDFDQADRFITPVGNFVFEDTDSPGENCNGDPAQSIIELTNKAYVSAAPFSRNISVWDACAYESSLNKHCVVELQLSSEFSQRNGGMVVNYHVVDPDGAARIEYFLVMLDHNKSRIRVLRYTGTGYIEEFASRVLPIVLDDWYRIEVTTTSISPTQVAIGVTVSAINNLSFPTTSFSVVSTRYLPDDGLFGVGANNAQARFSYFRLEEL
jgi:hypothetical protein